MVGLVVEQGREPGAHVVLDEIGQHAQQDVGAYAQYVPMEDRPNLEVGS
jgi:hypothetical protein